jgi:TonB family protein
VLIPRESLQRAARAVVPLWWCVWGSGVAAAQGSTGVLTGTVRDSQGRAVIGAVVAVAGSGLSAETDAQGRFRIAGVAAADVSIRTRRIGFKPDTIHVVVAASDPTAVRITLERVAYDLAAVVVEGHGNVVGPMAGFYQRADQGQGRFFTAEQIEERGYITITDVLRAVPGARIERGRRNVPYVRFRGATSPPQIFIDGVPMGGLDVDLLNINARSYAGIEVYSGIASVPPEFSTSRILGGSGGVILLWTRQGEVRERRPRRGESSAAALVARLLDAADVFTADQVDRPAMPDPSDPVRPVYPDSLYRTATAGEVIAEFVVNSDGVVRAETFSIVTATHPAFGEAVRRAMLDQRFLPAVRGGNPVAQIVQLPISFRPEPQTTARERRP